MSLALVEHVLRVGYQLVTSSQMRRQRLAGRTPRATCLSRSGDGSRNHPRQNDHQLCLPDKLQRMVTLITIPPAR